MKGRVKEAKATALAQHAARAVAEGRQVFVANLNMGMFQVDINGPISGWAEMIEAVEHEGWFLQSLSMADSKSAVALFRRSF